MTIKEKKKLAGFVIRALKVCENIGKATLRFEEKMDNSRNKRFRRLAKKAGISYDDFCEEVETMRIFEEVDK